MVRKRKKKKIEKGSLRRRLFVLGAICLFFVFGKLILSYRKSIWKKGRLNFVLATEPILVLSLSPDEKSLIVVKIPKNTYVETTRGFGLYKIESVYPLGELEGRGGQLLAETAQEFLGAPVEAHIGINSKFEIRNSKLDKEEIVELKRKMGSWRVFLRPGRLIEFLKEDMETNLSFWDIAKIWLSLKKVNVGRISFIDLEEKMILTEFSLPDGGIGRKGNPLLIDNFLQDSFFELEIRKEKISVEVLNGTDYSGLGQRIARIIANIGGKISKVGDSQEKIGKCQIKGDDQALKSFTLFKIKKIFDCQVLKGEKDGLILVIGDDYPKKLFSKE